MFTDPSNGATRTRENTKKAKEEYTEGAALVILWASDDLVRNERPWI